MHWLRTWWLAMTGAAPTTDPWEDDPKIRAERHGQHERVNKVTRWDLERQRRERRINEIEAAWRREHD